ncbi:MAG: zinc ribbon domain-containing protein [Planctomycetes bacterium]|nr:zinc ribbon domain-containing protein [Planctomycetota bacterium]
MPTYDYVCGACGHALEIFHSMTEAAKKKCPKCGKSKLERRIGAGAGFLFKGQGFYKTDYRSDSYKAGEKAESSASADAPKSEAKADGKSAPSTTTPAPAAPAKPEKKSETKP